MSSPIGMAQYFAMEAGEYLDRLGSLLGRETPPPADELVRYARALRGSALMANQPVIARAAAGLEGVSKAYREGRRAWEVDLQQRLARAVTELRTLVRTVGEWDDQATDTAERLAHDLESIGGVASPGRPRQTPQPSGTPGSDAGVRAFVAREGALTASALDRAAKALETSPDTKDPLYAVLRRLQSLRGLAALTDLAPLPDMLESIERAVAELTRMFAPPPQVAQVFETAAQALARAARDVAQNGRPAPEAEEPRRFAELLLRAFATEDDVVPIDQLFPDRGGGIVTPGRPMRPSELGTVELVSQGERLCEVADDLERATSPALRDMRLYAMVTALRPLETATGSQVPAGLAALAGSARELIASGGVREVVVEFAACIREAGSVLRGLSQPENARMAPEAIESVSQRLHRLGAPVFQPIPQPEPELPREAPEQAEPVVPIESLLLETTPAPAPAPPPAPTPAPAPPVEEPGLAGSYARLARLMAERGTGPASLDELLAGAAPAADGVVDISTLCYRGQAALDRAAQVRRELDQVLARGQGPEAVRPLLDEMLDLVALAAQS